MVRLARGVGALGAAFKITGDRRYADAAVIHLRAWFVTPATRMTPSLLYSQAILGSVTIDATSRVLDRRSARRGRAIPVVAAVVVLLAPTALAIPTAAMTAWTKTSVNRNAIDRA